MATKRNSQKNTSGEGRKDPRKAQKIGRLAESQQVQRLLSYYGLSLTEPMTAPIFGADHRLQLSIYNDQHELAPRVVVPSLDYLSQDLGFVNAAGYEAIKNLDLADVWRNRLLAGALSAGKHELQRYLRNLRPLLMERQIYFYCTTPVESIETIAETGQQSSDKGKRPLSALPMSVQAAELYGCSPEEIAELAPQVAWLIPMLVVYRKVKATDQLLAYLDGWLALLTPQQNERMHTAFVKHVPYMVNDQITQQLLAQWKEHQ
jgi:hypothetical protein